MPRLRMFAVLAALCLPAAALAEDPPALAMELNAIDTLGESCRLTFVLQNTLAQEIDKLVTETVLFSDDGRVVLLTLFDFGALPVGRPRVRQFQVPDTSCDRLGQVLVNGADTCQIDGTASPDCADHLALSSRVRIQLEG